MSQAATVNSGSGPVPPVIIQGYVSISFADSAYTVQPTDYFISVDTSGGPVIVNLPDAPAQNTTYIIKDRTGNASLNNITVKSLTGASTIDQAASYPIAGNFGSIQILYHSSNYEVF